MLKTSNFNEKMSNMHTHPNGSPTTKKATSLSLACSRIRSRNEKIDNVFLLFLVPCTCYHVPGLLLSMSRVVIKSRGLGIFPGYEESGPWLLLLENRRKIEPKEIPSCLISPPTCCVYPATWNLSDNPAWVKHACFTKFVFIKMFENRVCFWSFTYGSNS